MANRVCLGARSGAQGLWISKPGFNVLTAGVDDLLFSTDNPQLQVVQTGSLACANGSTASLGIPNLGYLPVIMIYPGLGSGSQGSPWIWAHNSRLVNSTTVEILVDYSGYDYTGTVYYAVLRVPADG